MLTKNTADAKRQGAAYGFRGWRAHSGKDRRWLTPIEEVMALSTNSVAHGCLEAIEVLEMCRDQTG
jgi:hypothetical protein